MSTQIDDAGPLLEVRELSKHFSVHHRLFGATGPVLAAVDRVSMTVGRGQVYGLAGESGSGKSTLGRLIVGLLRPDSGRVTFGSRDLGALRGRELRAARRRIQIVFQDPSASLSPRRTIEQTLLEPLHHFAIGHRRNRRAMAAEVLHVVGLDAGALPRLPHQFSSGQRQRISIARALLCEPELLIADEAVSALDVSVQAQILQLILELRRERGIAFLFISHDLAVIRQVADAAGVMYRGQLVETGTCADLFADPRHPYTRQLLAAVPDPDPLEARRPVPSAAGLMRAPRRAGCVFAHRCPEASDICRSREPDEFEAGPASALRVKCHLYAGEARPNEAPTNNR